MAVDIQTLLQSTILAGDPGYSGSQGTAGYTGSQGADGVGTTGYTGSQGADGVGTAGYTGSQGADGVGTAGYTGSQGTTGYTGSQGADGVGTTGYTGSQGADGVGTAGYTGSQGTTGYTGSQGSNGFSDWLVKTANYTAVENDRIMADTSSGSFTVFLPSAPTVGSYVQITDGSDFEINNLTIDRNGLTIEDVADNLLLSISGITYEFIYNGTTWHLTTTIGVQGAQGYTGSNGISDWTIKTANYTALINDRIIADTSGGGFTVTLPLSPTIGSYVQITDGASFGTNNLLVDRNGSTIEGFADNVSLSVSGVTYEFIYDGSTWQLTASVGSRGEVGYTGSAGNEFSISALPAITSSANTDHLVIDNGNTNKILKSDLTKQLSLDQVLTAYHNAGIVSSGTYTPDCTAYANDFLITLGGTVTIEVPTVSFGTQQSVWGSIEIINGDTYSIIWGANWDWGESGVPTLTSKSLIGFYRKDSDVKTKAWHKGGFA